MSTGAGRHRPAGTWVKRSNGSAWEEFCACPLGRDLIQIRPDSNAQALGQESAATSACRAQSALLRGQLGRSALCARWVWSRLKPLLQAEAGTSGYAS
jgi:hypothetical protein